MDYIVFKILFEVIFLFSIIYLLYYILNNFDPKISILLMVGYIYCIGVYMGLMSTS
jgi:hypothetical protein